MLMLTISLTIYHRDRRPMNLGAYTVYIIPKDTFEKDISVGSVLGMLFYNLPQTLNDLSKVRIIHECHLNRTQCGSRFHPNLQCMPYRAPQYVL